MGARCRFRAQLCARTPDTVRDPLPHALRMTQASQNIPEQLRAVRAALEPLAATDVAAIAHARISLAAIATNVPDDCADAQRLLRLATHVASRIGADAAQADDDARRLRAVRA